MYDRTLVTLYANGQPFGHYPASEARSIFALRLPGVTLGFPEPPDDAVMTLDLDEEILCEKQEISTKKC